MKKLGKMSKARKIAIGALAVSVAACVGSSQLLSFADKSIGIAYANEDVRELSFDNVTGSIDLSNISLSQLSNQVTDYGAQAEKAYFNGTYSTKTLIVSLDTPSVVESMGANDTVEKFLSTTKGKNALNAITDSQYKFLKSLSASAIDYKLVNKYSTVINAVAIEVNTSKFNQIADMTGVSNVGISLTYSTQEVDAQVNPSNVYGTGIYDSSDIIETYGIDGSGVTVAILDTGLDYTHEAFTKYLPDPDTLGMTMEDVKGKLALTDQSGTPKLIAAQRTPGLALTDVYLSDKVPFAYDYSDSDADVYPSYSQHGTHVAGIVAGKADTYYDMDGNEFENFSGAAPNAQLVICKVFTDDLNSSDLGGARSEDIIAALDDCVTLGVDIINMSLGTTSGFSTMQDEDIAGNGYDLNRVYKNIKETGISLIAAAGNEYSSGFGSEFGTNLASNPDSGTVGSPSTYAGAMSVASINGQQAPYMLGNPGENSSYGDAPIYYYESNDANAVPYSFADDLLGGKQSETFTYLVIPGTGSAGDYSMSVRTRLQNKGSEKILVVVRRGTLNFKDKVEIAHDMGADGIIVYNNVSGSIRMSLGDLEDSKYIPAVSINMDAGLALTVNPNNPRQLRSEGKIKVDKSNLAGPFMDDYSSWGATPDLKLKPDITSHGGDIISTVAGGYEKMSGTSMATPNLAGLMALVKNYLRKEHHLEGAALTTRTNQIVMSSATLLYDQQHLPYSPRKQGAGLATLDNIFTTKAYLWTDEKKGGTEDNRPKIELGEDEKKKGEYEFTFYVTNFGSSALSFSLVSRFFTESLSPDGLAVAQQAYMLDDEAPSFKVEGAQYSNGKISVGAGGTAEISVKLTLSAAEKKYLNDGFKNGMYVEGFISLVSESGGQCDLNLPFMGFYGDWESAPLLDKTAYEMSEIKKDTSLNDNEKPHESVFATQLYSTYYNGRYALPMGSYAYLQDESAEQIYATEEYCSISRFNIYNGPNDTGNYMTSTGIRALYAGLLRNAELITYDIYNVDTGELVYQGRHYSVGKAYANGGSARPALVDMKLDTEELGLINNGKYEIEFNFYMKTEHEATMKGKNTFSSNFYVDYDAPILESSRIRYYEYKDGNKTKQRVYLDLDIYDNHYPQAVLLCYSEAVYEPGEVAKINLATDYVTPIYNPVRNGTTTVTIEITDIYEKYGDRLYVQIDDYALNHNVFAIDFNTANEGNQGNDFNIVTNDRVTATQALGGTAYNLTLDVNEMYKVELDCGDGNAANYQWSTGSDRIKVKNGEIFGVREGNATVYIRGNTIDTNGNAQTKTITLNVTVVDNGRTLPRPALSFGLVPGVNKNLELAQGTVRVNAGQTFQMEIKTDPWYYPIETLTFEWESSDGNIAKVDQNGVVTTMNKRGTAIVSAYLVENGKRTQYSATVTLSVAEPFDISSNILNHYYGSDEIVYIPDDENVMYIAEDAFEDNNTMRVVVIPQTVVEISDRAFRNCTALEEIYFINSPYDDEFKASDGKPAKTYEETEPVKNLSALNLILAQAFSGCTNLKLLDLKNVKVITVGDYAFMGTPLERIDYMEKIGIAGNYSFAYTNLKEIDITGLHTSGVAVFSGCTSLTAVETGIYTSMGEGMFFGCSSLKEIEINNSIVPGSAFEDCRLLETVTFGGSVLSIGDYAFANTNISEFTMPAGVVLGDSVFAKITKDRFGNIIEVLPNNDITIHWEGYDEGDDGAVYNGTTLVKAPSTVDASFQIKSGTTAIGDYAFADVTLNGVTTIVIPDSVTQIGIGAFARTKITSISIPSGIGVISAYAFMATGLEELTIPSTVTRIEEGAFAECENLATVGFASNSQLAYIGSGAFSGTAIQNITLPSSVTTMGDMVFYNCTKLVSATLTAVTSLGGYTFEGCGALQSVTFGANATASGYYTFFPGLIGYDQDEYGNPIPVFAESSLTTVDLGGLTELGDGVFSACVNLTGIDLKGVTKIGRETFASCTALTSVTNLDKVTDIGMAAFANTALEELTLTNAKNIGAQAFINVEATSLSIPKVEVIGAQAFAGISITELELPATLKTYGDGAFMAAVNLRYVSVANGNSIFFAESNVLYRNVINARTGATSFELCLYPAARQGNSYTVKEGTSGLQGYSFAYLNQSQTGTSALTTITLPYSIKTIGASAFLYSFSIATYNFESIQAPRLLSEYYETGLEEAGFNSLYYTNFYYPILNFVPELITGAELSTLTIGYPSNGIGYNNYVFNHYFGRKVSLGEMMDDNTRELINLIDSFFGLEGINSWEDLLATVQGWNSPDTEVSKQTVWDFCDNVKYAHSLYNNLASAKQRESFGADRVQKLNDIEEALKPVKSPEKFDYPVNISMVSVASSSKHRSEYKAGETFDMTGLVVEVVYDDYTTDLITDISQVTLLTTSKLRNYDIFVSLEYKGFTFRTSITVTADNTGSDDGNNGDNTNQGGSDNTDSDGGCNGCGYIDISTIAGGTGLMLIVAAGMMFISHRLRRKKND